MEVWFITDETSAIGEPGCSLICLAWDKMTALKYLRDIVLGSEYFYLIDWELSVDNPDYHYGRGEWNGKVHYFLLCTEEIEGIPPPNNGIKPTPE
jgi:hypothetical protein